MSIVMNSGSFMRGLDKSVVRFNRNFALKVRTLMNEGMRRLIARTPVHTGQAVSNYVASVGQPNSGPVALGRDPVEATNPLPLGAERLRGGAARVAMTTLTSLSYKDPFQNYWITNRSPNIAGLEAGELPLEPLIPRSPLGMFAVTLQELAALARSGKI